MKVAFVISLFFISQLGLSQTKSRLNSSLDFIMMTKALNNNDLSNDLKDISSMRLSQPLNCVGLTITSGFIANRMSSYEGGYNFDGYIEYLQVIPQRIMVQDSIEANINGFNFGITLGGIDLLKNKKFDLITCFGFNTGRVWLKGTDLIKQKNPYFSPMIAIVPRVCLGKISIQLRCAYDYDISNKNWKRKGFSDSELMELSKFSYQGLNMSMGIGYVFK
jgi:hypothetical protein